MSQPSARQLAIHQGQFPGAQLRANDPVKGVVCSRGDIVPHVLDGWHVCLAPTATYPANGLRAGESNDQFHWSQGPSFGGQGVPQSYSPPSNDAAQTGIGSDGRLNKGPNGAAF